jgi:hypothetical protein
MLAESRADVATLVAALLADAAPASPPTANAATTNASPSRVPAGQFSRQGTDGGVVLDDRRPSAQQALADENFLFLEANFGEVTPRCNNKKHPILRGEVLWGV